MDSFSTDDDSSSGSSSSESSSEATTLISVGMPLALDPDEVRASAVTAGCQELIIRSHSVDDRTSSECSSSESSHDDILNAQTTSSSKGEDIDDTSDRASPSLLHRLRSKLSREGVDGENNAPLHHDQSHSENEHILSFLAFDDSLSVESDTASVEEKKQPSNNRLDRPDIARVDVYCGSGTVIISRAIFTNNENTTTLLSDDRSESTNIDDNSRHSDKDPISDESNILIRRIIRRNVSQQALRSIFTNPPKLATIDASILEPISVEAINDEDVNIAKEVELARFHVATAILNATMIGGDDLERIQQLNSFDYIPATHENDTSDLNDETDQLQMEIRNKIEMADTGLAILMGEKEKLEKMMGIFKGKAEEGMTEQNELLEEDVTSQDDSVDSNSSEYETSDDEKCIESESETLDGDERIINMGCEVEYSFPAALADELEAALLNRIATDETSDSEDCHDDDVSRGRSTTKREVLSSESKPERQEFKISPNESIPTNGEGCIVLREDGSFNIVGLIPQELEEHLFQNDAPFPEYIALGSKDRYFVKFDDDSYYIHGPKALSQIMDDKMTKLRKARGKSGVQNDISIASVAFGKGFNDFFIVFKNGSWQCGGELHEELDKLLTDRRDRADLEFVSIGPNNEYFLKAKNGRFWWGGVACEIDELLFDIAERNAIDVCYVSFGVDGTYFLCHHD